MPAKIRITFAQSALNDLKDILKYIGQKVPQIGKKLIADVIGDIELLAAHLDMGRIVPEFEAEYLRELIRPPFRIVYHRDQDKVRIVRVWRSELLMVLP